nr:outer membrane beta-barrel protein [Cytophagales bacterium]
MTEHSEPSNKSPKPTIRLGLLFRINHQSVFSLVFKIVCPKVAVVSLVLVLLSLKGIAQETVDRFEVSGYLEAYYAYDFSRPSNHERPSLLYNFKRHNEFSLNLALVQLSYKTSKTRTKMSVMSGTYAQYNLANEPVWGQAIYEASVGVRLLEDLWLDVGVMPSHIGFESAIGADCWHLSRSLLAENSPYFLTGARLTYPLTEKIEAVLWLTNGWQNIQRQRGKQGLGTGLGVVYRPSEKLLFNYANYLGNEGTHPIRMYRFFNNFFIQKYSNLLNVTLGADYGIEHRFFRNGFNHWYGITLSLQKEITDQLTVAGRGEYYSDSNAVILESGMRVSGFSVNLDYQLTESLVARIEGRQFISPEPIFEQPSGWMNRGNLAFNTALAVRF